MMQIGFGGSLGREQFSKIQGEFINETKINWRVKVRVGPMRVGYSTPEKMNDNFIKTSHVMAAMRRKLKANFCMWHLLFTKKFHQPQEASITILPETLQTSFKSCFTLFTSSSSTFRVRSVNWRKYCRWTSQISDCWRRPFERVYQDKLFDTIPRENIATGLKKKTRKEDRCVQGGSSSIWIAS